MRLSLEQFWRDIRFGVRHLAKAPSVSILAVVSLAAGVMATTAIYSVVHAVILDPFPYKDVDRLMSVRVRRPRSAAAARFTQSISFWRLPTATRSSTASSHRPSATSCGPEPATAALRGNHGTFNTFDVMGVPPLIGRTPAADRRRAGAPPVVVLGYRFWQRQFGGDPQVLGRQLRLNDTLRTIIGVMPPRFMWRGADVYLPTAFQRGQLVEGVETVHLLGRLKSGVTNAQAEADLNPIISDLQKREPKQFPEKWRVDLQPFSETFRSGIMATSGCSSAQSGCCC